MAVTKKNMADSIHANLGLSKRESADIVDYFFQTVKEALKEGNSVKLPRFGTLHVKKRKPKKGRNPATGEEVFIPPRNDVVFKPSRILRDKANSKTD